MKNIRRIAITTLFCIMLFFVSNTVLAEDEDTDIHELELDTEILNNKKEDVNSTTSISNINLFSSEYGQKMSSENESNQAFYYNVSNSVFTDESSPINNSSQTIEIFTSEVTFNKNIVEANGSNNYSFVITIMIVIIGIVTYIASRLWFLNKKTKEAKHADYSNSFK